MAAALRPDVVYPFDHDEMRQAHGVIARHKVTRDIYYILPAQRIPGGFDVVADYRTPQDPPAAGDRPHTQPPAGNNVTGPAASCPEHKRVQHRDGRPPWCDKCRRGPSGVPVELLPRHWEKKP